MTQAPRRPGRIDEAAVPLNATEAGAETQPQDPPRAPGRVEEPAQPMAEPAAPVDEEAAVPGGLVRAGWKRLGGALLFLLGGLLATRLGEYLAALWPQQPLVAAALGGTTVLAVVLLGLALRAEALAARRVSQIDTHRERVLQAAKTDDPATLDRQLAPQLERIAQRFPDAVAQYRAAAAESHHAADRLRLFDNLVLSQVDREVDKTIDRTALTVGAAVAIVPHPALDALVVLWRALTMVRRIAALYGLGPTRLSSLALLRHAIVSAVLAAGMETAGDLVVEEVGRGVLASGGQRLAQTAVTASRLRRLGRMTRQLCRPLPPTE